MRTYSLDGLWRQIDGFEYRLCLGANRGCRVAGVRRFFATVSRLGDGPLWYCLMLAFAASGSEGARVSLQMAVAGVVGALLYRELKHRLVRERPFVAHGRIRAGTAPLDRYSFPSGHTLHAVAFATIVVEQVPVLAWPLLPFAATIAASRVVLGLHYPTDVLAGGLLGFAIARAILLALA